MLDKALHVVAIGQTILTSMRAASRAFYILKDGEIGVMKGPLILPPHFNETSDLFDLTEAFRDAVIYGYEHQLVEEPTSLSPSLRTATGGDSEETSQLTDFGIGETVLDDEIIANFLEFEKGEREETDEKTVLPWRSRSASLLRNLFIPFRRFGIASSSLPRQTLRGIKALLKKDEIRDEDEFFDGSLDFSKAAEHELILVRDNEDIPPRLVDVKAYAPHEFRRLRSRFGISEVEYLKSILETGPFVSFQSNSKGAARSGGIFYFTRDGSYMIKTIKRAEVHALLQMLPKYFHFMRRNGRKSLLTRICGMYEAKFEDSDQTFTFVVTNSVFPAEGARIITERFDLKGSTLGRECSEVERLSKGNSAVLKDLDLAKEVELTRSFQLERDGTSAGYGLNVGPTAKAALLTQLRKDLHLLIECGVIDYSLLVGVAHLDANSLTEDEMRAVDTSQAGEMALELAERRTVVDQLLSSIIKPATLLLAPPLYFYRKGWNFLRRSLFWPLPYYGSGICGIDAGQLSRLHGDRKGQRSLYFLGVIDFLQPFNAQKTLEWKVKKLIYREGFSCVPPEEYADRFLSFLECNLS